MPRSFRRRPSAMTNGVLPLPPTEILPTLITGHASRRALKTPRSYSAFLTATAAPKMAERAFMGHEPGVLAGRAGELRGYAPWRRHSAERILGRVGRAGDVPRRLPGIAAIHPQDCRGLQW